MSAPRFDGADYVHERDHVRLGGQIARVYSAMEDGRWRSLQAIAVITGDPPASISAQLRNLRKARFGAHEVERAHRGGGLYAYRLTGRHIASSAKPVSNSPKHLMDLVARMRSAQVNYMTEYMDDGPVLDTAQRLVCLERDVDEYLARNLNPKKEPTA